LGELLVRGRRWLAGGLLAAHYVGVLVVLFGVEGQRTGLALFRDTLRDAPEFVIPMFGVYAAGQVVVWTLIVQDGAWAQHDRVGGTLETGGGTT
jgi:hypothetical protein